MPGKCQTTLPQERDKKRWSREVRRGRKGWGWAKRDGGGGRGSGNTREGEPERKKRERWRESMFIPLGSSASLAKFPTSQYCRYCQVEQRSQAQPWGE